MNIRLGIYHTITKDPQLGGHKPTYADTVAHPSIMLGEKNQTTKVGYTNQHLAFPTLP